MRFENRSDEEALKGFFFVCTITGAVKRHLCIINDMLKLFNIL